jgi:hypothetical protein
VAIDVIRETPYEHPTTHEPGEIPLVLEAPASEEREPVANETPHVPTGDARAWRGELEGIAAALDRAYHARLRADMPDEQKARMRNAVADGHAALRKLGLAAGSEG